jgi:hypothetical protein
MQPASGSPPSVSSLLRRKLLWILALSLVAFGVALIDGWLTLRDPSRVSFLGFPVDDVRALVRTASIAVVVSLAGIGAILTFWKPPKP